MNPGLSGTLSWGVRKQRRMNWPTLRAASGLHGTRVAHADTLYDSNAPVSADRFEWNSTSSYSLCDSISHCENQGSDP